MMLARLVRHVCADVSVRRAFPSGVLAAIERAVGEQEKRHLGELRFAVEGGLPAGSLATGQDARDRAVEVFARLGVWDTEHNSGVLIYVLLGDRAVEIVADRGILARVGQGTWEDICRGMERHFAAGRFESGALEGIARTGELLARHFPASGDNPNELSDKPTLL
jgi:hypothetical protein